MTSEDIKSAVVSLALQLRGSDLQKDRFSMALSIVCAAVYAGMVDREKVAELLMKAEKAEGGAAHRFAENSVAAAKREFGLGTEPDEKVKP